MDNVDPIAAHYGAERELAAADLQSGERVEAGAIGLQPRSRGKGLLARLANARPRAYRLVLTDRRLLVYRGASLRPGAGRLERALPWHQVRRAELVLGERFHELTLLTAEGDLRYALPRTESDAGHLQQVLRRVVSALNVRLAES